MKQTTRNQVIKVLRYSMPFEAAAMAYLDKPALCVIFISIAIIAFAYDYEAQFKRKSYAQRAGKSRDI